ncbi:conserved hypothetical protein [Aspergillus terreus NIH2624]|uniref:Major facilitator superfamily (MFS) profile domain-containing protein n=1 Tax=Aspergillus terreus (strain NIH 2624 / FGSC A1156) TaxID=341663 RepID=Q0CQA9_ASPTN|nr:uncharacterized protein ATEG_04125 [Aspergillus terreus NIH2624]EAU35927.1 conserved hypothetical protein [Aspergillus terreus NIH2624]
MYGRGLSLRMGIMLTCQISFVLFGAKPLDQHPRYNQGVFSGIVGNENFLGLVGHPSSAVIGIIVSIYNLGCVAGTALAFMASDKIGFRRTMWFSMAWILVGATVQTCAYSKAQLLVARFVTGIGTGIMSSAVPVYQSELCDARKRGMPRELAASHSVPACLCGARDLDGIWLGLLANESPSPPGWSASNSLPESPRWLFRGGRNEEGIQVLCDVYDRATDDPKIVQDCQGIFKAIEVDNLRGEYRWSQIFKKDELHTGRRVLLAYGLQFMNQMGGVNVIVSLTQWNPVLEVNVGMDKQLSLLLGGAIQVMFVIGSFYPTFYSDRLGRRKPMIWGSIGLFVCMLMISILLSFKGTPQQKPAATASVAFFFLFMLIFGASINCIPWVYGPELLPLHVRAKGQAIGVSANWTWNFFVAMIAPCLIEQLAWKGYLIFMALNLAFVPCAVCHDTMHLCSAPLLGSHRNGSTLRGGLPPWVCETGISNVRDSSVSITV